MWQLKYKYSVQILKEKGYYIKKNFTNFYEINYVNIIFWGAGSYIRIVL